ncbi:hypothetical protein DFH09DRAFT_1354680 [Mycena vulgaris]|nr:hypothetical protein DFH09DRAFT_1354680 [Mycena vulgaris]
MPPPSWASTEQATFLAAELPAYLAAKENSKKIPLVRYWNSLDDRWFQNWPEEAALGLQAAAPGVNRPADELQLLGSATDKRKGQLKAYLRYQDRPLSAGRLPGSRGRKKTSLFKVLDKSKAKRNLQVREMYQKLYHAKIKVAVMERGYGEMNEEAQAASSSPQPVVLSSEEGTAQAPSSSPAPVVLSAEEAYEADRLALLRIKQSRRDRLKLWRATTDELWDAEPDDVKKEVEQSTKEYNESRAAGMQDPGEEERTPEQYQHTIDQIGGVYAKVHEATTDEAGWIGHDNCGRAYASQGRPDIDEGTPNGNTFEASHPDFKTSISAQFVKFLKRAYPHDIRDSRAIATPGDAVDAMDPADLNGLISMAKEDDAEELPPAPAAKERGPKRIRRPKPAQTTPSFSTVTTTPMVSPATSIPAETSLAPSVAPDTPDTDFNAGADSSFNASNGFESPPTGGNDENPFWGGMPPPTSPRTAGAIASFEQTGRTAGLENIDPALYGGARPPEPFTFSPSSPYRPSTLFQAFSKLPRLATAAAAPSLFGSSARPSVPTPSVFSFGVRLAQNPPTPFHFAPPASAVTPTSTGSMRDSVVNATQDPTPQSTPTPSRPAPSSLRTFTSAVVNATRVTPPAATPPSPPAPVIPQYIESRPPANFPKGHPLAPAVLKAADAKAKKAAKGKGRGRGAAATAAAGADAEDDLPAPPPAKRARMAAAPDGEEVPTSSAPAVMTAAARAELLRIRREEAEGKKQRGVARAKEKALEAKEKEREAEAKEVRRLKDLLHNPAGNHALFIIPGRPKRNATAAKDPNGNPVALPVKLTRAQQVQNRNAPSEKALLQRGQKRGAVVEAKAPPAKKRGRR